MNSVRLHLLALLAGVLLSCSSTVPAAVTRGPSKPIDQAPTVLVSANQQAPRIKQSLRDAGVRVDVAAGRANYSLSVDLGSARSTSRCGTINNVRYVLSQRGAPILVIKGRGATGSCSPNIFDDMSRLLASYF